MGFYQEQVLPRINEKSLDRPDIAALRRRVIAPLSGTVVEIGFGSGLNVEHYPKSVDRVLAIEPSVVARHKALPRIRRTSAPVEFAGDDAEDLPLSDASADCALVTWTLCGLTDPLAAARELHRVLVPGGLVVYLEHGASPDPEVARWQRRLNGFNRRFGGCWLDREPAAILAAAGFVGDSSEQFYLEHAPRFSGYVWTGSVWRPALAG